MAFKFDLHVPTVLYNFLFFKLFIISGSHIDELDVKRIHPIDEKCCFSFADRHAVLGNKPVNLFKAHGCLIGKLGHLVRHDSEAPALAASIEAFNVRRFVRSDIPLIISSIPVTFCETVLMITMFWFIALNDSPPEVASSELFSARDRIVFENFPKIFLQDP